MSLDLLNKWDSVKVSKKSRRSGSVMIQSPPLKKSFKEEKYLEICGDVTNEFEERSFRKRKSSHPIK